MTNKEKYKFIDDKIKHINSTIFKNFKYKFSYETHGSGEYCIIFNKIEYKFATLGDVITFLTLFNDVFCVAMELKSK